jgi:hypothetical protein
MYKLLNGVSKGSGSWFDTDPDLTPQNRPGQYPFLIGPKPDLDPFETPFNIKNFILKIMIKNNSKTFFVSNSG